MRHTNELVGKPIVNGDTGERVGKATDLLVSHDAQQLIGVVVSRGVLGNEKGVLPFEHVRSLGGDVIVADGRQPILDHEQWRRRATETIRSSALAHKRFVTTTGRELGQLSDVCFNEESGRVSGFEVAEAGFAGLVQHHRVIEPAGEVIVGPDLVLVSGVVQAKEEPRGEAGEAPAAPVHSDTSHAPSVPQETASPTTTFPEPPIEPRR
jgi:uncharacterized protein YrrD